MVKVKSKSLFTRAALPTFLTAYFQNVLRVGRTILSPPGLSGMRSWFRRVKDNAPQGRRTARQLRFSPRHLALTPAPRRNAFPLLKSAEERIGVGIAEEIGGLV